MRLTDTSIRALSLEVSGSKKHWDETIPGFGVRCSARSKSFFVMYGRDRRLKTIGKYPQISLREARFEAKRLLAAKPGKNRVQWTTEAIGAYIEDAKPRLRPNTLREYRRHLDKAPNKRLDKLVRADVNMSDPQAIKTWKVFFNWCLRNDLVEKNPFQYVPVVAGQRTRVLSKDELKQF
ncbi:MAG: Arm DNA-binding domain-containing protein, partial [Pseudomonadota bacterium]